MINMIGIKNRDERMIGISNELRDLIQSKKFNNLFESNVPFPGLDKINLLRTTDISLSDQASLIKNGLGDILHHPTAQILSSSIIKNKINMKIEEEDIFKASSFSIKFLNYKTPTSFATFDNFPSKFSF